MKSIFEGYQAKKKKEFQRFIKLSSNYYLYYIDDYVDLFLIHFKERYQEFFGLLCSFLKRRKIYFQITCDVEKIVKERYNRGTYLYFKPKMRDNFYRMSGVEFEDFLSVFLLFTVIVLRRPLRVMILVLI